MRAPNFDLDSVKSAHSPSSWLGYYILNTQTSDQEFLVALQNTKSFCPASGAFHWFQDAIKEVWSIWPWLNGVAVEGSPAAMDLKRRLAVWAQVELLHFSQSRQCLYHAVNSFIINAPRASLLIDQKDELKKVVLEFCRRSKESLATDDHLTIVQAVHGELMMQKDFYDTSARPDFEALMDSWSDPLRSTWEAAALQKSLSMKKSDSLSDDSKGTGRGRL